MNLDKELNLAKIAAKEAGNFLISEKDNISTKPIFLKKMSNEKNHISVYGSDEIWNFSNPFFPNGTLAPVSEFS